jgi:molybdopterin synthase catalytic subunit
MDEHELKEEIRLIKDMVEKTRKTTAESGAVFIFWGFVIIAAIIGTYALIYFSQPR